VWAFMKRNHTMWLSSLVETVQMMYSISMWYCKHCTLVGRQHICTFLCTTVHSELFLENLFLGMFRSQGFAWILVRNIKFFSTAPPRGSCVNRKMVNSLLIFQCFSTSRDGKKEKERENSRSRVRGKQIEIKH
jgi:hypothetical protein